MHQVKKMDAAGREKKEKVQSSAAAHTHNTKERKKYGNDHKPRVLLPYQTPWLQPIICFVFG
jgi:hypothetical protein